jgi:GNAT superfamily N-acetyltransferase
VSGEAVTIRPRVPADDDQIVAIYNRQEADSRPLSIDEYRQDAAEGNGEGRYVAIRADHVAGYGELRSAWWTGRRDVSMLELRVDRQCWGQGIGSALLDFLHREARERGAAQLLGWVRENVPDAESFATRRGFTPTGEVIEEYRLDLQSARLEEYAGIEQQLREEGIRIARLADPGMEDAELRRALYALWKDASQETTEVSFESWQESVLEGPGLSPEWHWIALDGGLPVGMTFLKRLGGEAAENDYTGVAPSYRGRGIAQALKLRAIVWGREQGLESFYTASEVGNARMIAINRRLGYEAGARRVQVGSEPLTPDPCSAIVAPQRPSRGEGRRGGVQ